MYVKISHGKGGKMMNITKNVFEKQVDQLYHKMLDGVCK